LRKLLVTGGTGFVGRAVIERLASAKRTLVVTGRSVTQLAAYEENIEFHRIMLDEKADWTLALAGVETIIHTAARVHMMKDKAENPLVEFRATNVTGTVTLARQAAQVGVKRFIFISSIKVNGEGTLLGCPYTADDVPAPVDFYGISKMEAELALKELAVKTGMEVVIIRPVLVYGPGVKANFLSMMHWLDKGIPLPLGALRHNRRSLVALDNLIDLIVTCIDHPAAANQTFLVNDGEDLSTTELLQRMAKALDRPARLLRFPPGLLLAAATLLGKKDIAQRLCGSLQVDIEKTRSLLGWNPPVSVDEALKRTAKHFHFSRNFQ